MRYQYLRYRFAVVVGSGRAWSPGEGWPADRLRFLGPAYWRPAADVYETATTVEVTVELAGVAEDDIEVQLFEDAVVVEGRRQLPACQEGAVYHAAGIRQGPFRVELPLPAAVESEGVDARHERGLLRLTLVKRREAR